MIRLGVDFWNDSCDLRELSEAVARGAVGATSNPVIVSTVVEKDADTWSPCVRALHRDNPGLSDEALAWKLVDSIVVAASQVLLPVYERTKGAKGILNVQVDPELARDPRRMIEHARHLAKLAPNLAVKIPLTKEGLEAIEVLSSEGIRTNATVSFSIPQALAAAEAMERGMRRSTVDESVFSPYVTIMVGRVADHMKRVQERDGVPAHPDTAGWAGIAIFKKAHRIFRERGLRPALVAAAYRHERQWSELIGEGPIQSMPYAWWTQFDATDARLTRTIDRPVPPEILRELTQKFPDFARAYEEDGMRPEEFAEYGASVATLRQFQSGYRELVARVRRLREAA